MDRFLEHLELRRSGKVRESGPLPLREARVMVLLMECPLVLSEDIGCYPVLRKWLRVVEALSDGDSLFGAVTAMTEWLSDYAQRLLPSLCALLRMWFAASWPTEWTSPRTEPMTTTQSRKRRKRRARTLCHIIFTVSRK